MENLEELYQEIIMDHNRNPRGFGEIADATHFADGYNETCGDEVCVGVKIKDNIIEKINFSGQGCAISRASASMMCSKLKGMHAGDALSLAKYIVNLLKDNDENLEKEDNDTIIAEDCCKKNQHLNCDKNNDDCGENNNCTECLMERFSLSELGDLSALSGVKKFPMRVKCATLAWHTFENAVSDLIVKNDDSKK